MVHIPNQKSNAKTQQYCWLWGALHAGPLEGIFSGRDR